jgi:hypothetical protein
LALPSLQYLHIGEATASSDPKANPSWIGALLGPYDIDALGNFEVPPVPLVDQLSDSQKDNLPEGRITQLRPKDCVCLCDAVPYLVRGRQSTVNLERSEIGTKELLVKEGDCVVSVDQEFEKVQLALVE